MLLNLLIIDYFEDDLLSAVRRNTGLNVLYLPQIERQELLTISDKAHILLLKSKTKIDASILDSLPDLKLVVRAGSGVEHIDKQLLIQRGIALASAPQGNCDSVGEQAVGMLLSLLHNIIKANNEVANVQWLREPNRGNELAYRTVGVIGFGNTGSAFAQKLSGFGCKILAYDKYKTGFGSARVQECSLEEIIQQADVLSFHVPLTAETHHYLNDNLVQQFAKPFWLLNLSRGEVIDSNALIKALDTNKIRGAGLDVFENENLSTLTPAQQHIFENLTQRPNVIMTPHIGGWSFESAIKINQLCVNAIENFVQNHYV